MHFIIIAMAFLLSTSVFADQNQVKKFLFIGGNDPQTINEKINDQVAGVQVVYSWKSIETAKDKYDFARIERDLQFLQSKSKASEMVGSRSSGTHI